MKNLQKGNTNVILIVIIVILAASLGYIILVKKPTTVEKSQSNNLQNTQPPVAVTQSLPATCIDKPEGPEGAPVITSVSSYSGSVGTSLEIRGCNFSGFELDKNAWIENNQGTKGLLRGEAGSTKKLLNVTLKSPLCQKDTSYSGLDCDAWLTLAPGEYKIYASPWGKNSNKVTFTIK